MSEKSDTDKSKGRTSDVSQTAPDAEVDLFFLERVYPDPAPLFRAHKVASANEKSVLVALDTSALLLPYQIKSGNVTEVGKAFDRLFGEQRLFVPGRVVREFTKHRDMQLAAVISSLNKRRAGFSGEMPPLLGATSGYDAAASAYSELADAQKKYAAALDELVSEIRAWRGDDPVVSMYARVFNNDTIIDLPWNEKAKAEYLKEMSWRYENKVPPGYKDARKEDGGIGDFLIWKSLLSLGAIKKMELAFVTGEQKSDWFVRGDGGPVYPRHELVDEYRRASDGKSLRLMSLYELLEEMKVADEVVLDVKHAEAQANTAALLQKTSNATLVSEGLPRPLTFITNRQQSFWGPAKQGEKEGMQLRGIWSVTNVTDRNYHILDARLPNHDASFVYVAVEDPSAQLYSTQHPIRPNSMTGLTANFFFFPSICGGTDPFVTDVIFTDNYGGQHLVPSVRFHRIGMP